MQQGRLWLKHLGTEVHNQPEKAKHLSEIKCRKTVRKIKQLIIQKAGSGAGRERERERMAKET